MLSAWAATDPEEAAPHFQLLCDAAACGDFGEWVSDEGEAVLCRAELEDPCRRRIRFTEKAPDVVRNLDAYEDRGARASPVFVMIRRHGDDGEVSEARVISRWSWSRGRRARSPAVDRQLREAGITPTGYCGRRFCGAWMYSASSWARLGQAVEIDASRLL